MESKITFLRILIGSIAW